ncbi:MAG: DUF4131 domain-containing protein, partial [Chloroherpetonaceae bacterium]|nr:DUF4131 domain-containing protein [Chloroherpetonaceae bacterium]
MVAYPALRLLIQIVLGILLGHTFPNLMKVWYGITVGLLLITLLAVLLDKKYPNRWFRHTWTLSYLLSVPTGFAAYLASLETQVPPNSILHFANKEVVALTRAESDAKTKNQVAQWTASIERIVIASETLRVSGVVRIRRYQKDTSEVHLKIGEMCWLQGKLEFPKAALNQGEFDYRAFLAEKGIDLLLVSSDKKALLKTGETKGGWLESQ